MIIVDQHDKDALDDMEIRKRRAQRLLSAVRTGFWKQLENRVLSQTPDVGSALAVN